MSDSTRNTHGPSIKPVERTHGYPPPSSSESDETKASDFIFVAPRMGFRDRRLARQSNLRECEVTEFGDASHTPASDPISRLPSSRSTTSSKLRRRLWLRFRRSEPDNKEGQTKVPPIVVPSWRWKATPQTVLVRDETEFSVTCTIVHPVSRLRIRRPSSKLWSSLTRAVSCFCFKRKNRTQDETNGKGPAKAKKQWSAFRGGVAVEQDIFDDSMSLVVPPSPSPVRQPQAWGRMQILSDEEQRTRATHRNSGWAGVFSSDTSQTTSDFTSSDDNRVSFIIDPARNALVLPEVDISVAYLVKEESEDDHGAFGHVTRKDMTFKTGRTCSQLLEDDGEYRPGYPSVGHFRWSEFIT
ncbi:uncharacterized protein FOMMEDRAFT_144275 [Fomitiporia mediterranea MF3/22]|uniref:uncharacterized protein n=1 Tax=Fomitiporia mediterranea (strain MF3/22) TaxID=694068 RepID=UPI0004408484|nr:uncharacterized protein FOMMEDRAFT_144275 [Fomitiporia mediterranea MF3/22]EJD08298.1 hypothetical protein FOMMEDRAFT_144275 [Fomitiporia mediterranea MF3/22]